jgi:2-haloacid dehalogenase
MARPDAVVFDVVETLMSLAPLRQRLNQVGQPPHLLDAWFARTLRDGMALSLAGDFQPFPAVARAALQGATRFRMEEEDIDHVMAGFAELPAHPDAAPAMDLLADAGITVACLTNGSAAVTTSFLERSGLRARVERVVTVEEVGSWKPPAAVYRRALDALGTPASLTALVAVHAWDCHGAKRAGLLTGWASRLEGGWGEVFSPPDVRGEDLVEVARGLLEL